MLLRYGSLILNSDYITDFQQFGASYLILPLYSLFYALKTFNDLIE